MFRVLRGSGTGTYAELTEDDSRLEKHRGSAHISRVQPRNYKG